MKFCFLSSSSPETPVSISPPMIPHIAISPGVVKARMGQTGIIFSGRYLLTMKEVTLGPRVGHGIYLCTHLEKLRLFTEKSISKYVQNRSTGNIMKCQWM